MFPLNSNMPYIKDNGERDKLGNVIGSGGGGGSITPDYENEVLDIGTVGDWHYFVPMSKEYVGDGIVGYEIETDEQSSSSKAMINIYGIIYADSAVVSKTLIKQLVHNGDYSYDDEYITVTYVNGQWSVTSKSSLYGTDGSVYESPLLWQFSATVDYKMLTEDPTA